MPTSPFRASAAITQNWQHFDFSVSDGIATVTLNRPDKLNPLTFDSYADLRHHCVGDSRPGQGILRGRGCQRDHR